MRKNFILALVVCVCGFLGAEELGLEFGAELGFGDVADEATYSLAPLARFSKTFGSMDVSLEAKYTFTFDEDTIQELYFEPELTYNLPLGSGSLALALHGENTFFIDPDGDMEGLIEPSVKYSHELDFGDLSGKVGLPYTYSPDSVTDLYFTLGYGKNGFGVELTAAYNIDPKEDLSGYEALFSYETDAFYGELVLGVDKDFKVYTLSPYGELYLGQFTIWAGIDFGNLGDSDLDVTVEPYVGATYKF